jgi:hypothetical protein
VILLSYGNSTENSAPLVYANLETVNSVYPAQERLNYSFNSASNHNSSYILPGVNIYEEEVEEEVEEEDDEEDQETTEIEAPIPIPNPPTKKRGRPPLSPTTIAVRIENANAKAKEKKMNNKKSKIK